MAFFEAPGPLAVRHTDIELRSTQLEPNGTFLGGVVDIPARLYYPADQAGENATARPNADGWPGICFTHGRLFTSMDQITQTNHLRATGLLHHLVSHGYVVISVNMTIVDQNQSFFAAQ